jgi:hypothetical protein
MRRWWLIAALGLGVSPLAACESTSARPCYALVGAAGDRVVMLNACTGDLELRDQPRLPTTTTLPPTAF